MRAISGDGADVGLTRRGIVGAWFAGSATALTAALQAVKLVILARLLDPNDFGVVGMAAVVIAATGIVADLGLSGPVIKKDEVPTGVLSSLYWLSLSIGIALALGLAAASPWIAVLFHEPRVAPVLATLSIVLVVQPLGALHQALAEKALYFRRLATIDVTAAAVGGIASVAIAANGGGVVALVADTVLAATTRAVLLIVAGRSTFTPRTSFAWRGLRGYLTFGLLSVGQRTANYASANIDYALIGGFLGASALGVYKMAYELATLTPGRMNLVLGRVFFPVLARVSGDRERFRAAFLRMQETTVLLGAPVVVGIALIAPLVVPGLLGERWRAAEPLLRILCIVGLGRVIGGTIGPTLLAAGRPDLGLRWSLLAVVIQVPVIWWAVTTGQLKVVAWTFVVLQLIHNTLNYFLLVRAVFGPLAAEYAGSIFPALGMTAAMAATVWTVARVTPSSGWPVALAVQVAVGAITYGLFAYRFKRTIIEDLAMVSGSRD